MERPAGTKDARLETFDAIRFSTGEASGLPDVDHLLFFVKDEELFCVALDGC